MKVKDTKMRHKITFSEKFMDLCYEMGCEHHLLTAFIEMVFIRRNVDRGKRLNGFIFELNPETGFDEMKGYYLLDKNLSLECMNTFLDEILLHQSYGTMLTTFNTEYDMLKIPNHGKRVTGNLYKDSYRLYKQILNPNELELLLRAIIKYSNGAYFVFSKDDLKETLKEYPVYREGVAETLKSNTVAKNVDRMLVKLLKTPLIREFDGLYSNAPNIEQFMLAISESEKQWRANEAIKLRSVKNECAKLNRAIDLIEETLDSNVLNNLNNIFKEAGVKIKLERRQ